MSHWPGRAMFLSAMSTLVACSAISQGKWPTDVRLSVAVLCGVRSACKSLHHHEPSSCQEASMVTWTRFGSLSTDFRQALVTGTSHHTTRQTSRLVQTLLHQALRPHLPRRQHRGMVRDPWKPRWRRNLFKWMSLSRNQPLSPWKFHGSGLCPLGNRLLLPRELRGMVACPLSPRGQVREATRVIVTDMSLPLPKLPHPDVGDAARRNPSYERLLTLSDRLCLVSFLGLRMYCIRNLRLHRPLSRMWNCELWLRLRSPRFCLRRLHSLPQTPPLWRRITPLP